MVNLQLASGTAGSSLAASLAPGSSTGTSISASPWVQDTAEFNANSGVPLAGLGVDPFEALTSSYNVLFGVQFDPLRQRQHGCGDRA